MRLALSEPGTSSTYQFTVSFYHGTEELENPDEDEQPWSGTIWMKWDDDEEHMTEGCPSVAINVPEDANYMKLHVVCGRVAWEHMYSVQQANSFTENELYLNGVDVNSEDETPQICPGASVFIALQSMDSPTYGNDQYRMTFYHDGEQIGQVVEGELWCEEEEETDENGEPIYSGNRQAVVAVPENATSMTLWLCKGAITWERT